MGKKKDKAFKPFSEKKQAQYERVARLQYGAEIVNQSVKLWNSYGKSKQEDIMEEGGKNYRAIVKAMEARGITVNFVGGKVPETKPKPEPRPSKRQEFLIRAGAVRS